MKRLILSLLACIAAATAFCQDCIMPLRVVIPSQVEPMDASTVQMIKNKLRQIATQNGISGGSQSSPFALTALVDVVDKEVISSSPIKYVYVLNVNLFVVDTQDETIYSSTSVEVRCAGNSEIKAYANGIKQLNPKNAEIQSFVESGKNKMLSYYDTNYLTIIKKAQTLSTLRKYEEALFYLMSVPQCSKGYDAAMAEVAVVYQQYIDQKCNENLAQAKSAWMSGFTTENAAVASIFLSEIYPDAACYDDAQALVNEIKEHMSDEWDFKLKRWDDNVDIEKQKLSSAMEIATAFAENQPDETVSLIIR